MRTVDLAIIAAYLAGVTWFGARFKESQTSLKDYFLGGQTAPWWAIALSIVSAETSTLTIIGTPPLAYAGSYVFLQVVFGYLLARLVISTIFLPRYFERQMFTAYELMQRRFGPHVRKVASGIFLVTRALAEGVRVFAISIVISIILKTGGLASIAVIMALTLFYTFEGGMTAVIWTDVVQMCMYVVGASVSFFVLIGKIPGGFGHALDVASAAGKLQVFDLHWSWAKPYTIWAGLIGGCFLTTASHGTDQLVVQRLLSAKNQSQSRAALFSSWIVIFIQFTLFLTIGMLLWVYRNGQPPGVQPDRLYPSFIWASLPVGVAGLAMAAIIAAAMANLSAALNSLASATVVDFYEPLTKSLHLPAHYLKMARFSTVFWGVVLGAIALVASQWGSVLESGLRIASVTLGILLGLFLLGVLTKKPGENAAIAGVIAGLAAMLYVKFATNIPFTWWVMIGSGSTFGAGYLTSFVIPGGREKRRMSKPTELKRDLGLLAALAIVIGTVIGSGIFRVPQTMINNVGTVPLVFLVWVVGGALSLAGALTYAELAAAMPGAGGEYVYLTEAWGPVWGFLYSWVQMWIGKSGSIATLATAFFEYTAHFIPEFEKVWITLGPFPIKYGQVFALVLILVLGTVNYFGVRFGGGVQVAMTAVKLALIAFVIVAGILYTHPAGSAMASAPVPNVPPLATGFVAALVAALWAYDGWNNVGMVASEIKNPGRNLPLSLILGTSLVIAIYMLANWAYFRVLSPAEVGAHKLVAAEMMQRVQGPVGAGLVSIAAMISIFAALNGSILTGARVPYAAARDGLFFKSAARVHPVFRTPGVSILMMSGWAALLVLSGKYDDLFNFVIFGSWILYAMAAASVFVLRRKRPDLVRPYKTLGYPVIPVLFLIGAAALELSTLRDRPVQSMAGILLILLGLPFYFYWNRKRSGGRA